MESGRLRGQVAFVTGGSSGIGRATVLGLAAEGATVAIVDRDERGAALVAAEVGAAGGASTPFVVDLTDPEALEEAVVAVLRAFGRIDILVNSAGISGALHASVDFTLEEYEIVMAINLRAPFLLTRAIGRHMIERGGGGKIVNISSSGAFQASLVPAIYAATKAGINGLTRASAGDLGPHDVNVNAVAPGLTHTPMTAGVGDKEQFAQAAASGPLANLLRRHSEPEDVANVVVFLCLPESRQITGQVVHTSAGQIL